MLFHAVAVSLYYGLFLFYGRRLISPARGGALPAVAASVAVGAAWALAVTQGPFGLGIAAAAVAAFLGFRMATGMRWLQALCGAGFCIICACAFGGMIAAAGIYLSIPPDFVLGSGACFGFTLLACCCAIVFCAFLHKKVFEDALVRRALHNQAQLRLVLICETAVLANLGLLAMGYPYLRAAGYGGWFAGLILIAGMLAVGMPVYAVYQSAQSAELLLSRQKIHLLEEQHHRQLKHYGDYQTYIKRVQTFEHDIKPLATVIRTLLVQKEYEKALEMADAVQADMQTRLKSAERYSGDVTIDALLQDVARECQEQSIRFSAQVIAVQALELPAIDWIRIFSNITGNAIQACLQVSPGERFIDITCRREPGWLMIEATNAYNGYLIEKNGRLLTTRAGRKGRGLGLDILREAAESRGGFVIHHAKPENRTFSLRVHLPLNHTG